MPKDERRLRIGYAALTEHRARMDAVSAVLREQATKLNEVVSARGLKAAACAGYFATCDSSFNELLERGVLAVPASIFGSRSNGTVLSSLSPRITVT